MNPRYAACGSHYAFEPLFCMPASGNEKPVVENRVKTLQRRWSTPVWDAAECHGYGCPIWMTFQQAKQFGGHVKKGEHSTPVVFASTFTKPDTNDVGEETDATIPCLKEYRVFNAEQCEGLPERFRQMKQEPNSSIERIAHADAFSPPSVGVSCDTKEQTPELNCYSPTPIQNLWS
jgi:hypothetical protein